MHCWSLQQFITPFVFMFGFVSFPVFTAQCHREGRVVPRMHHRDTRFRWTEGVDDSGAGKYQNLHNNCWLRYILWRHLYVKCLVFVSDSLQRKLKIEDETKFCGEDLLHTLLRCKVRYGFCLILMPIYKRVLLKYREERGGIKLEVLNPETDLNFVQNPAKTHSLLI